MSKKRFTKFSVPLGLVDYINPVFYAVTVFTVFGFLNEQPWRTIFLAGGVVSLIFGLSIPTLKTLIGLGKLKFKMPVILVFLVNSGIFVSGLCLWKTVYGIPLALWLLAAAAAGVLLWIIYRKSGRFNTAAVLIGAVGYVLVYASLIAMALRAGKTVCVVLYAFAILLFVMLCGIGIRGNLKDARVHWVIEISNIVCQFSVALSTVLLAGSV